MRLTLRLLSSAVQKRPFYITTPIFYVNAAPHLGHLYTAVVADAIQRFEKLTHPDCNVIFSTGTDEHGTKIQQAAAKADQSLLDYCTNISNEYRNVFREYNVEYTDFIRTTEQRHNTAVKHFWNKLMEGEYVYKAAYAGWYSVSDEAFVPEAHLKDELRNGVQVKVSTESGQPVEWTEESNYMFRLSAFRTHLLDWLKRDAVITPHKFQKQLQELLEKETYIPDISISRPSSRVHWAIRVPGDEEQSIYVWLDALINYLTVIGYPDEDAMKARGRAWPADVQVVGKDILKFHGIYWPAFLMAVKWHPPRRVVCHSHWTVEGAKMSKSRGNVQCPHAAPVGKEALRYFLLRESTLHSDANYSETKLLNIINSELADTLGNLASRSCGPTLNPRAEFPALHEHEAVVYSRAEVSAQLMEHVERLPELADTLGNLASRSCGPTLNPRAEFPALHEHEAVIYSRAEVSAQLMEHVERLSDLCRLHYTNYQFYKAVDAIIHVLHLANLFFETHKPWELRKDSKKQKELDVILHITIETLRICGIILQPIIPEMSTKLLDKLQIPKDCRNWQHCEVPSWRVEGAIHETKNIQSGKFVLFQRVYTDKKKKAAQ